MTFTINRNATLSFVALVVCANPAYSQLLPPTDPVENPTTEEKRILGKILFWDEQLASDDTVACGTCHIPAAGGSDPRLGKHPGPDGQFATDDDTIGSPGIVSLDSQGIKVVDPVFGEGLQVTPKASPGIFMSMYAGDMFWDGRARTEFTDPQNPGVTVIANGGGLESQAVGPILNSVEMAHQNRSWTDVIVKLISLDPLALAERIPTDVSNVLGSGPSYPDLFADAFGDSAITPTRIALAIGAYERTLVPDQTPWDRFMRGEQDAMTAEQIAGWTRFEQETVCDNCHTPPHFTDHNFYNIGLRPAAEDVGRQNVTLAGDDFGSFKTPSLRNVGLRTALTHAGWIKSTQDAVDFYNAMAIDTGHTQFTDFQSIIPTPNGGPSVSYALVTLAPGDPDSQAPVLDFLENALTDPRAATESFPFDRPLLASEKITLLSYNLAGAAWTAQRADLVAGIIQSGNADIVGLQETSATMLSDLEARIGSQYDVVTFANGSSREPVLLRQGKFTLLESNSAVAALSCNGHEFINYVVVEYISSAEKIVLHNNNFCPPDTIFSSGKPDAGRRNEAMSVLLAETILSNQSLWRAPGVAVGDFNATDVSSTIQFLLNGDPLAYADSNPVLLEDSLQLASAPLPDPANTQWSLATGSTTGLIILDAVAVANADTAAAADNDPLRVTLAIDTTPSNIQPSPGSPADSSAPSSPGNFIVAARTETSLDLSWNPATDDTGVSRYRLFRDGKLAATTTSTGYSDDERQSGTSYSYLLTAIDTAGNESTGVSLVATTVSPPPPVTPPSRSSGGGAVDLLSLLLLFFATVGRSVIARRLIKA